MPRAGLPKHDVLKAHIARIAELERELRNVRQFHSLRRQPARAVSERSRRSSMMDGACDAWRMSVCVVGVWVWVCALVFVSMSVCACTCVLLLLLLMMMMMITCVGDSARCWTGISRSGSSRRRAARGCSFWQLREVLPAQACVLYAFLMFGCGCLSNPTPCLVQLLQLLSGSCFLCVVHVFVSLCCGILICCSITSLQCTCIYALYPLLLLETTQAPKRASAYARAHTAGAVAGAKAIMLYKCARTHASMRTHACKCSALVLPQAPRRLCTARPPPTAQARRMGLVLARATALSRKTATRLAPALRTVLMRATWMKRCFTQRWRRTRECVMCSGGERTSVCVCAPTCVHVFGGRALP